MLNPSLRYVLGAIVVLASLSPAMAQPRDPLTQFLDSVFKRPAGEAAPAPQPSAQPQTAPATEPAPAAKQAEPAAPKAKAAAKTKKAPEKKKAASSKPKRAAPQPAQAKPEPRSASKPEPEAKPEPQSQPAQREEPETKPVAAEPPRTPGEPPAQAAEEPRKQEEPPPVKVAEPPKPESPPPAKQAEPPKAARSTPAQAVAAPTTVASPAPPPTPTSPPVPRSPAAALDQVNAYFNSIDQLTAYFVQKNPNGQQVEGTLAVKRPGILQFAYAPPSTLEIVSDGRNVAIRDKKLGTNDVYPVGQTPLKFLLQENVDLGRDTKVRDVQIGRDGMVTVRFEDDATLGGTSKITLRFDSRANALRQWTIVDAQGYETSVTLSNLNVVQRKGARAAN